MHVPETLVVLVEVCGKEARPSFRAAQTPPARPNREHRERTQCQTVSAVNAAALPSPLPALCPASSSPLPLPVDRNRTGASAGRLQPDAGRRAHARRRAGVAAGAHSVGRCAAEGGTPRDDRGGLGRALDHCTKVRPRQRPCMSAYACGGHPPWFTCARTPAVRVHDALPTSTQAPVMEQLRCGEPE